MNIPILLYHSVSEQTGEKHDPWAISPQMFDAHLSYLRDQGYQPFNIEDISEAIRTQKNLPQKPIVITFDDGLEDFLSNAVPVLKKNNFPATLFVTTGFVGGASYWAKREDQKTRPMLSWKELAALDGINIGAHTHNHTQMDLISLKRAKEEVTISKVLLERELGIPITTFAFPHGYYSARVIALLKDAGYSSACIVGHAMATDSDDVFTLPRIIIKSDITIEVLELYLQGVGLNKRDFWHGILRMGWWFVRKIRGGYIPGLRALLRLRNRRSEDRESNK